MDGRERLNLDNLEKYLSASPAAVSILTVDGEFGGLYADDSSYYFDEADAIQELMIEVMKKKEHRKGLWAWHINKSADSISGELLADKPCH